MIEKINIDEISFAKKGRKSGYGFTREYVIGTEIDSSLCINEATVLEGVSRQQIINRLRRLNPDKEYKTTKNGDKLTILRTL